MSFDSKSASGISPNALIEIRDKLTDILNQLSGSGDADSTVNVTDRADRDLGKVNIAGIDAIGTIAGQAAMAASLPVVIASDQSNVPVTQATHDSLNLNANIQVANVDVGGGNPVPVTLATVLSSSIDSIDVAKMTKGSVTTAHDAITATATSFEIGCGGFNAISVECACSAFSTGNWVITILGCALSGGTFGACYSPKDDGTFVAQATPVISVNGNTTYYFKGAPNFVKILATRTTDGTLTCKVTPMNL